MSPERITPVSAGEKKGRSACSSWGGAYNPDNGKFEITCRKFNGAKIDPRVCVKCIFIDRGEDLARAKNGVPDTIVPAPAPYKKRPEKEGK